MSYSNTHQWKLLAQELIQARAHCVSVEFHAAYSFLNPTTLNRIASGEIGFPPVKTQLYLYRCIQKARQSIGEHYGQFNDRGNSDVGIKQKM